MWCIRVANQTTITTDGWSSEIVRKRDDNIAGSVGASGCGPSGCGSSVSASGSGAGGVCGFSSSSFLPQSSPFKQRPASPQIDVELYHSVTLSSSSIRNTTYDLANIEDVECIQNNWILQICLRWATEKAQLFLGCINRSIKRRSVFKMREENQVSASNYSTSDLVVSIIILNTRENKK